MQWEAPLMAAHAEVICRGSGDVLNVGFGMGIIDTYIQGYAPRSHTIIEAVRPHRFSHARPTTHPTSWLNCLLAAAAAAAAAAAWHTWGAAA